MRIVFAIVAALLAAATAFAQSAVDAPVVVRTPDQPQARRIPGYRIDGVDYVELNDVAYLFRGTKYWRAELEKMVLKVNGHRVRLTVGSPFVFVDDDGAGLLAPVRWHEGRIVVPVRLATEVLDDLVSEAVSWDRSRRVLRIDTGEPNVQSIDYDVRRNGTVVVIGLSVPLTGELEYPRPGRVEVRVPGGVLAEGLVGQRAAVGLLDSLDAAQEPGYATLTFQLGPMGGTAELLTRASPPRLLLAVREEMPDDIPLPAFERRAVDTAAREVRVVVLDPGHGGSDPGVISASGLPEKDIALNVALRAKERLEQDEGMTVYLTRSTDRFVSGEGRAERANRIRPDVVVSIHCNGWFDPGLRGFSVGVPGGDGGDVDPQLPAWGTRSVRCRRDTEALAEFLLDEMGTALPLPNRGVRSAEYAQVRGITVPAVHVECGFLSNPNDASMLVDPEFQETVATALARGIGQYRRFLASGEVGAP